MTLFGKVALVTGGSRGIGRAIVLTLAKAGADVAINYAGNTAAAEETAEAVKAMGRKAIVLKGDVADTAVCEDMIKQAVAELGRLDILVNNAGITRDGLLMRMKEEDWDAVIATNLKSMYNCSKAVMRTMMKQKAGRIINMASVVGETGNAGQANYAAAKAGVIGFTKALAKEVSSRGITANVIAPGFIATDMTKVLGESVQEEMLKTIPLGRPGDPQDVANAVLFFASEEAAYITGQVLNVDGGMVMYYDCMKKGKEVKGMSEQSTFEKVKAITVDQLSVAPEDVKMDSTFIDDLGADSLDIVELIMAFEEEFNTEIPDDVAEKIRTVRDAVELLDKADK